MKLTHRFLLFKLLFILGSVHFSQEYDLSNISKVLIDGMDLTINPCDNFFDYACGKWIENNELPEDAYSWNTDKMTEMTAYSVIEGMLKEGISENDSEELSMEKRFYNACMDTSSSRKEGLRLFQQMVFENAESSWQHVVKYYASKIGEIFLFDIKLNMGKYFQIERALKSTSNRDSIEREDLIVSFRYLSQLYDGKLSINSMNKSIEFLQSVYHLVNRGKANIIKMTISELQQLYDEDCPSLSVTIDWFEIFQKIAENGIMNFEKSDSIYVDVNYMEGLCQLLSRTSDNAIVNYVHYNFIMDPETFTYINDLLDEDPSSKRNVECIVNLPISHHIFQEFIRLHIPEESKNIVKEMTRSLQLALQTEIENSWLVDNVKKEALKKAKNIVFKVSLRPKTPKRKDMSYDFEVGPIALQNQINCKKAQRIEDIITFKTAQYERSRSKRFVETDSCYSIRKNKIYISPTYFFPPFFDLNAPIAFNYARLGFIIGHELSHAFDYERMRTFLSCVSSNYTEEMKRTLEEKRNCFVSEFDEYNIGAHTINENICDRQGLLLAFKTMRAHINLNNELENQKLPNLETWNQKQLFFLSFANEWCSNPIVNDLGNDDHSPNKFRVLGTLSNMKEFVETLNCQEGTPMNSLSKCDLWSKPPSQKKSSKSTIGGFFKNLRG